jgi:hypothetical protein
MLLDSISRIRNLWPPDSGFLIAWKYYTEILFFTTKNLQYSFCAGVVPKDVATQQNRVN